MTPTVRTARTTTRFRGLWLCPLLTALALVFPPAAAAGERPGGPGQPRDTGKASREPGVLQAQFTDGSTLKLTLLDERIELNSPYGRLLIPVADIRRIDFATRIPDDIASRIDAAIASLGNAQFKQREAASAELLKFREKAYPALLRATKHTDQEIARRAEEVLERLREAVPAAQLETRPFDIVVTEHSRIAGRISASVLRATTTQFGEVPVKLADLRSLSSGSAVEAAQEPTAVSPDPGKLINFHHQVGKSFAFRVTGAVNGSVWGTDVYTSDSDLAVASVHAGVLRPGESGVVRVTIVPPLPVFQGSTRNGVTSSAFGPYPGAYRVSRWSPAQP